MNILKNKTFQVAAVVLVGVIVFFVFADSLQLGDRWTVHAAVGDLSKGRNIEKSMIALAETPRGMTIEALLNALEDDDGTPWGKLQIIGMLERFKEQRAVRRALESSSKTTQRAAAYRKQGDAARRDEIAKIAMDWLAEEDAADRYLAVLLLRTLKWEAAVPDFVRIVQQDAKDPKAARTVIHALGGIAQFKPDGAIETVMALARDRAIDDRIRSEAFKAITLLDGAPRDELRELLVEAVQDESAPTSVRHTSVQLLGAKENGSEESWAILKKLLFDPKEDDAVLQRTALRALSNSYPLDRLGELLLDRRLVTHSYFGIRSDVAAGLGHLRVRNRLSLETLAQLVGDRDDDDSQDMVVRNAYLAYWMLTGYAPGLSTAAQQQFPRNPPPRVKDEDFLRRNVFGFGPRAPSVTEARFEATGPFTVMREDLMDRAENPGQFDSKKQAKEIEAQKVQQLLQRHVDEAVAQWGLQKNPEKKPPPKDDDG
ncbi:MAG: hypothetical protein AAGD14_08420 [Planctomycetota bacterium]